MAADGAALAGDPERRTAIQQLWTDGDYARLGELFDPVSAALVASLDLDGQRVLDAATGTGNTAIHAATAGAEVAAFDLTPSLLELARERAADAGVAVRFVEGDLLAIPFPDASFDVVLSTFGAFVVDDQRGCARELVRVARPGGRIVTTAWAPTGIFGVMVEVMRDHAPALFEQVPDQRAWAERDRLAALFAETAVDIELRTVTSWFAFPSVPAAIELFEANSGPVQRMRAGVAVEGGDWEALRADVQDRWTRLARTADGGIELPGDHVVATIHRR